MRTLAKLGLAMLFLSLSLFIISIALGDVKLVLLLIIPMFIIKGWTGVLSIPMFITALVLLSISYMQKNVDHDIGRGDGHRLEKKNDLSGIIFIGPIPIVFGSKGGRSRYPKWHILLIIGIVLFLLLQFLFILIYVL